MKIHDLDKERSLQTHSLDAFLKLYNQNLPITFPRVTIILLEEFRATHSSFFKMSDLWSLDLHRKKVMDWLLPERSNISLIQPTLVLSIVQHKI